MVLGGGTSVLANAELYDPASNTWRSAGSMHVSAVDQAAITLGNGKVFVTGGDGIFGNTAGPELYDPVANSWSLAPSVLSPAIAGAVALLPNGKVLVCGGSDANNVDVTTLYI